MAIQVRRGYEREFDPNKLLPGEWAVFLDTQKVWMCFAPGIVKRLGTYEDFYAQIAEATKDIRNSYVADFDEIKADIELIADVVSSDKEEVLIIKSDIINTYLPQIKEYVERAEVASSNAEESANNSSNSAILSESYAVGGTGTRNGENTDNAKYYANEAKKSAEKAEEIAGGDFLSKTGDASNTIVSFTKASTRLNIVSGEKQSTIFGKIMKWLADLTAPAFSQVITSYTDLMSNTVAGHLPDALAIKELAEVQNSNLKTIYTVNDTLGLAVIGGGYTLSGKGVNVSLSISMKSDIATGAQLMNGLPKAVGYSALLSVINTSKGTYTHIRVTNGIAYVEAAHSAGDSLFVSGAYVTN